MNGKRQNANVETRRLRITFSNGESKTVNGTHFLFLAFCLLTFTFCFPATALAQPEESEIAPPPLKSLSKEEKQQLDAEQNVKKYTQLALSLMEARLKTAETLMTENNYREALDKLGGFQILLESTLTFLSRNNSESDKVQYNFKRFELTLRGQTPRLEVMRRAMPSRYAYHVQKLIRVVRDARTKAIEPLFDDTVVPQKP